MYFLNQNHLFCLRKYFSLYSESTLNIFGLLHGQHLWYTNILQHLHVAIWGYKQGVKKLWRSEQFAVWGARFLRENPAT